MEHKDLNITQRANIYLEFKVTSKFSLSTFFCLTKFLYHKKGHTLRHNFLNYIQTMINIQDLLQNLNNCNNDKNEVKALKALTSLGFKIIQTDLYRDYNICLFR